MADSKKYDGSQWEHSLRKLTTATEAVENPLYSDGTAITNYTIKGNTVQSGTPTPSNPVDVQGVGIKTANLVDYSFFTTTRYVTVTPITNGVNLAGTYYAEISGISLNVGTTYYMSWTEEVVSGTVYTAWRVQYTDNTYSPLTTSGNAITIEKDVSHILFYVNSTNTQASVNITNIMFNSGSTAQSYEPYGYKIPISSGGVTTNIYLGSTQTVRQIKKMVFDGSDDEPWYKSGSYSGSFYCSQSIIGIINATTTALCDKAVFTPTINVTDYTQGKFGFDGNYASGVKSLNFYYDDGTATLSDFKTWLSSNPITVYYVLATPETAAVNEPLMKIGDYADTLSNAAQIPTTEGANSITVDTTVQPSEFSATWTGWHDSSVKEYDGTDWQ